MIIIYSYLHSLELYYSNADVYSTIHMSLKGIYNLNSHNSWYIYKNNKFSQTLVYYNHFISLEDFDTYDISMDYKLVE